MTENEAKILKVNDLVQSKRTKQIRLIAKVVYIEYSDGRIALDKFILLNPANGRKNGYATFNEIQKNYTAIGTKVTKLLYT